MAPFLAARAAKLLPIALWMLWQCAALGQSPTPAPAASAPAPVEITLERGARQTFGGFGASLVRDSRSTPELADRLTVEQRTSMPRLLWHDARFHLLRLWFNLADFAPRPGQQDLSAFVNKYVRTHEIDDARAAGVDTLLFGPEEIPGYLSDGHGYIRDDGVPAYAALLADFIAEVRRQCGVTFNATGLLNEPNDRTIRFHDAQWPGAIKALRAALDARGLQTVKIVAPESANCGDDAYRAVDAIRGDPAAWRALAGVATHSYNNAATPEMAARSVGKEYWMTDTADPEMAARSAGKEYWMTEAGGMSDTDEDAGDRLQAASISARFLNDVNHGVTHFIYFIGYELADPRGNSDRIIKYEVDPFRYQVLQKYDYLKQLSLAFDVGAVFRHARSSREGEMTYTYGHKPAINVAAARNPDGRWAIGISNFTSDQFIDPKTEVWYREQGGQRGQSFQVKLRVEELTGGDELAFRVHREGSPAPVADAVATMRHGELTLEIGPLELITLQSM